MAPTVSNTENKATKRKDRLAANVDKRLFAYAVAATAAGVGLLGQSAQAKVVYTAVNTDLTYNHGVDLDLNGDGTADFLLLMSFSQGRHFPEGNFGSDLFIYPEQAGNGIVGILSSGGTECAAALPAGAKIGAGAGFQTRYLPLWEVSGSYTRGDTEHCPWGKQRRGAFVGLKFVINHQVHYGWAHITTTGLGTVLNGFAYETVPNQAIAAGKTSGPASIAATSLDPVPTQPATLGILARGAQGLDIWRRSEDEA